MKFRYLEPFVAKNSILAHISLKIAKLGKIGNYDVIHEIFTLFWYVWKEETHSYTMVPNKHFQVRRGLQQPPWLVVLQKKTSLV